MQDIGEKCGVFGVFGKNLEASRLTFFGIFSLQHRGQESTGIVSSDNKQLYKHAGMGLVSHVFNEKNIKKLKGQSAIGHNRYSTSGSSVNSLTQPFLVKNPNFALAHNGNLPSTKLLEKFFKENNFHKNKKLKNANDSVMIAEAISIFMKKGFSIGEAIEKVFPLLTGAFCILILTKDKLIALRDSYGIRPLSIAKLNGGYVISSETCAFDTVGAKFIREVVPGEMLIIDKNGLKKKQLAKPNQKLDIFEFVYFSRPDSHILGKSIYEVRKRFGKTLAEEKKILADIVVPVPETAIPMAIGYAKESGIPLEMALAKNRYIQRTFIQPEQHLREQGVKMKLNVMAESVKGKRVIVIDDSVVRGTTSKKIIKLFFEAGAKEVHFLVSSPPIKFPDFYGIDISSQKELIAYKKTEKEIANFLGCTSLQYLTLEGMLKSTGLPKENFCTSCFTGDYPIDILERKVEIKY